MDQTLALQKKTHIPETLKNRLPEAKRTKEIIKEKTKDLLDSLNIVKKFYNLIKEMKRLTKENQRLNEEFYKTVAEIEKLMPAFRVQK